MSGRSGRARRTPVSVSRNTYQPLGVQQPRSSTSASSGKCTAVFSAYALLQLKCNDHSCNLHLTARSVWPRYATPSSTVSETLRDDYANEVIARGPNGRLQATRGCRHSSDGLRGIRVKKPEFSLKRRAYRARNGLPETRLAHAFPERVRLQTELMVGISPERTVWVNRKLGCNDGRRKPREKIGSNGDYENWLQKSPSLGSNRFVRTLIDRHGLSTFRTIPFSPASLIIVPPTRGFNLDFDSSPVCDFRIIFNRHSRLVYSTRHNPVFILNTSNSSRFCTQCYFIPSFSIWFSSNLVSVYVRCQLRPSSLYHP